MCVGVCGCVCVWEGEGGGGGGGGRGEGEREGGGGKIWKRDYYLSIGYIPFETAGFLSQYFSAKNHFMKNMLFASFFL